MGKRQLPHRLTTKCNIADLRRALAADWTLIMFGTTITQEQPSEATPVLPWCRLAVSFQGQPVLWNASRREYAWEDIQTGRLVALPIYAEAALAVLVDDATGTFDLARYKEVLR